MKAKEAEEINFMIIRQMALNGANYREQLSENFGEIGNSYFPELYDEMGNDEEYNTRIGTVEGSTKNKRLLKRRAIINRSNRINQNRWH